MGINYLDRREFLRNSMIGACGIIAASPLTQITGFKESEPKKLLIKRRLGKTGLELPVVSMGVMRSDNPGLVKAALESGIVHFDTAHGYMKGKNEEMLGEVFKQYPRESFVVGTKVVPEERDQRTGILGPGSTKEAFLARLETSLQRLQMKYVDILYVHGLSSRDSVLFPPMLDALKTAKEQGKAIHVGVSTHRNEPEVIRAAIESGVYEVVLTSINFKQDHYQEMLKATDEAAAAGIGIIGMKTMAGGFHDKEKTKAVNCKAALKWVLQNEQVTTTIPGITSYEQLAENAGVNTDLTLTEEEKSSLSLGPREEGLYCQGCEQCSTGCRQQLPIPDIMRAYMYAYGYGNKEMAHELLTAACITENPCINCSACNVRCAKGFTVAEKIRDISRLVNIPVEFLS
jgi:predicted aldo/keto reductase-like oxidoreductase